MINIILITSIEKKKKKKAGGEMVQQVDLVRKILVDFACQFIEAPYLCYTEHGLHALFFTQLYNALPPENRFIVWQGQKVCVIQKEYPTFGKLGKPQRQHWDIAVIKDPPSCPATVPYCSYDYLRLAAVIEFGLNEAKDHLCDDIYRLCHEESNVEHRFAVNLYRLSHPGRQFSDRDWSYDSKRIPTLEMVAPLTAGQNIEVILGVYDVRGKPFCSLVHLKNGRAVPV